MADSILLWNEVALEANRVSHSNSAGEQEGPPLSARALAIAHKAMFDALTQAAAKSENVDYAIAGAAHRALSQLFPSQSPVFNSVLAGHGDSTSPGHVTGVAAANVILVDRAADPGVGSATYGPSADSGRHRPDPENRGQGFHAPDYGRLSKLFSTSNRYQLAAPPFRDGEYEDAIKQVRSKGIKPELMGTLPAGSKARTAEETLVGLFWGYDGALNLGTPPRLYNQIIRRVAEKMGNSREDNARLFCLVNVAMADAGILSWEQKYLHDFWRPVVGVREHDLSMGPLDSNPPFPPIGDNGDPGWLPLGAPLSNRIGKNFTPPFPAYPSGHATFGAAALHMVRLFYGQGGRFSDQTLGPDQLFKDLFFVSEELNGQTADNLGTVRPRHRRSFQNGLWQMIVENGLSRVFLGVHWVFDAFVENSNGDPDIYHHVEVDLGAGVKEKRYFGGVPLGLQIAEDIFTGSNGKGPSPSQAAPSAAPAELKGRKPTFSSKYIN